MRMPSNKFIQGLQLGWLVGKLSRILGLFIITVFVLNFLSAPTAEPIYSTLSGTLFWILIIGWPLIIFWIICVLGLIIQRLTAKNVKP